MLKQSITVLQVERHLLLSVVILTLLSASDTHSLLAL